MKKITFDFWTNLCRCMGCNVGSDATVELSEEEAQLFENALVAYEGYFPEDHVGEDEEMEKKYSGMFLYLHKVLPTSLAEKICDAISDSFARYTAEDAICECGYDLIENSEFPCDVTEEEWDDMELSEQIDLVLEVNPGEPIDWEVVEIDLRDDND